MQSQSHHNIAARRKNLRSAAFFYWLQMLLCRTYQNVIINAIKMQSRKTKSYLSTPAETWWGLTKKYIFCISNFPPQKKKKYPSPCWLLFTQVSFKVNNIYIYTRKESSWSLASAARNPNSGWTVTLGSLVFLNNLFIESENTPLCQLYIFCISVVKKKILQSVTARHSLQMPGHV